MAIYAPDRFQQAYGQGSQMRQFMAANYNILRMREQQLAANASLLTYDQWKDIDRAVSEPARMALSAAADLIALGTRTVSLAQSVSQYQARSRMDPATRTMDARSLFGQDRPSYETFAVPIPFIAERFSLTVRDLGSPNQSESIDTAAATEAAVQVDESIEDMVINGDTTIGAAGYTLYGYINHPNRIIGGVLSQAWDTAANIYLGVQQMLTAIRAQNFNGPFIIYMNEQELSAMMAKEGTDRAYTTLQRILESFAPFGLQDIKRSDKMPQKNFAVVEMNSMNARMVVGQSTRPMQWDERAGLVSNFIVMAAMAPQIRPRQMTDGTYKSGVAHFTAP